MSFILGIDTSSIDLGIGLYNDLEPIANYSRFIRNSHAEHIAQVVDMLLSINNIKSEEIKNIAITVGPGSFTGLRIGIAFVKGFSFLRETSVLPVSSLEILAYSAINHPGRIISAIDARNNDIFMGVFSSHDGNINRLSEDKIVNLEDFKKNILPDDIIVTDTMGYQKSTAFNFLHSHTGHQPVEKFRIQRGLSCAHIGASLLSRKELWKHELDISPNYLRASSAQKLLEVPNK